jgi:hypothetical protein
MTSSRSPTAAATSPVSCATSRAGCVERVDLSDRDALAALRHRYPMDGIVQAKPSAQSLT